MNILFTTFKFIISMLSTTWSIIQRLVSDPFTTIMLIMDVLRCVLRLVIKSLEVQLNLFRLLIKACLDIDPQAIIVIGNLELLLDIILFRIIIWTCLIPTSNTKDTQDNTTSLITKGKAQSPNFKQSKRHYSSKKNKSTLIPIRLKPEDIPEGFDYKLAVTGTFGTRLTYQDMYKIIPIDKPKASTTPIFHNRLFVTWDRETLQNDSGLESAYMISFYVRKGSKVERGLVRNISKWKTEEGQVTLVEDFLTDILAKVELVNGAPAKELYLYAHNSGLFDTHIIIKALMKVYSKGDNKAIPTIIADNINDIYQLRIRIKGTTLHFRDSMKLFPISLKTMAANILGKDNSKFVMNHDTTRRILNHFKYAQAISSWNFLSTEIVNNDETLIAEYRRPWEYLKAYCIQDSLIIIESLKKLSLELRKLGFNIPTKECITASSLGIKVWKSHFNNTDNPVIQIAINTNVHRSIEKRYFGGRVEVFNSGMNISPIYHFDVPGLYAGMMCKELPVGNPVYVSKFNSSTEEFHKLVLGLKDAGLTGFFKCEAKAPENLNLPVLPIKFNGKLTFPLGSFVGTWAVVELVEAINIGYKLQPIDGWVFKAGTPLKGYSEQITYLKDKAGKEGNKAARTLMKLLTNSLYGKMASKYFTRATVIIKNDDFSTINDIYKLNAITKVDEGHMILNYNVKPIANDKIDKDLMKKAFLRRTEALSDKDLNIAVAATVTAQGRVQLYQLMKEVVARGGVICYVDTDSVFCTLPEAPFNKPFGPYTWVGPAEEHTFNKAIFIAPKMYYHEDLSGKVTFKVKGVKTDNADYTYEDLVYRFLKGASLKFVDQTQYRRAPKNTGMGIIITQGIEKMYQLAIRSKRDWVIRATEAYTVPLSITIENLIKTTAISKLPNRNLTLAVRTFEEIQRAKAIIPTTKTQVNEIITQQITPGERAIIITADIDTVHTRFMNLWAHAISTAAYNCIDTEGKVTQLNNLKYTQILISDRSKNVWKTIAYFKGSEWVGYTLREIKADILNQIELLNTQYRRAYQWTEIRIKINFELNPQLVTLNTDTAIVKTMQDIGMARKAFNETLETKNTIKALEAKVEAMTKMSDSSKEIIDILKTAQATTVNEFLKEVKIDLYNNGMIKELEEDILKMMLENLNINPKTDLLDMRRIVAEALLKRLELTMTKDFKIRFHRWVNKFEIILKTDLTNELLVRTIHILVFWSLETMIEKEHFTLNSKGAKYLESETKKFKTTPSTYVLREKWNSVQSIMYQIGLLSAVTFTPKHLTYDPESTDQVLKSEDKVKMINKLNSTKIFLRRTYLKWLEEVLFPIANDPEQLNKLIGLKTPGETNAIIVEIRTTKMCIIYLKTWMSAIKQDFYYNTHFADSRGRVYTELTNFRHIGSKWLRPLFTLDKSRLTLTGSWKTILIRITKISEVDIIAASIYWTKIRSELGLNISNITPIDLLETMKRMENINPKLNPQLKARVLEVETLLETGVLITTSPFQIDMKNNAIQHAATLVNNEVSILATGVTPADFESEDLYTQIAKRVLNKIATNIHIPEFAELAAKFPTETDLNKSQSVTRLRAIAKKPTMVSIYSATKITIIQYVYETLNELDITIRKRAKNLLANIIIDISLKASHKEMSLMNTMKTMVTNKSNIIEWNFGELRDFKPHEVYNKIDQKEFKIRLANKQFHTTYNLMTNKADTMAIKRATFVNIIHSLDALHLNIIINRVSDTNIITIHDAFLTSWRYNNIELYQQISENFMKIHTNHKAFKSAFNRLADRLGRDWTYDKLIKHLDIIPPIINRTGRMAA